MALRIAFPCFVCYRTTEWLDLTSERFFCDTQCFSVYQLGVDEQQQQHQSCDDKSKVIRSTREIRRVIHKKCDPINNQRCHIFGLNAAKEILNTYASRCARIDKETLSNLTYIINSKENLYCCSVTQNALDTKTERLFLDVFLYRRKSFDALDEAALGMYDTMKRLFVKIQEKHESPVITQILADFAKIESDHKKLLLTYKKK